MCMNTLLPSQSVRINSFSTCFTHDFLSPTMSGIFLQLLAVYNENKYLLFALLKKKT